MAICMVDGRMKELHIINMYHNGLSVGRKKEKLRPWVSDMIQRSVGPWATGPGYGHYLYSWFTCHLHALMFCLLVIRHLPSSIRFQMHEMQCIVARCKRKIIILNKLYLTDISESPKYHIYQIKYLTPVASYSSIQVPSYPSLNPCVRDS